jgi:hypothetical protein
LNERNRRTPGRQARANGQPHQRAAIIWRKRGNILQFVRSGLWNCHTALPQQIWEFLAAGGASAARASAEALQPLLHGIDAVVNCVGVLQDGLRARA